MAQGDMKKISIIVPVYYNEESLRPLYAELVNVERELLKRSVCVELIFVDDGSGDSSLKELLSIKQQHQETKVVKLTRNFGAVQASKTGFRFVTGDCFVILAADLQDPPRLIIEMVDKWLAGAKYVVCARADRKDPLGVRLFANLYYALLRLFVIKDYPARGYDLALMDRALLPYLLNGAKNINTPLFAYWLGYKPEVIQYRREERIYGRSRWTFSKRFTFFVDSLLGFSIVPIRLISTVGLLVSAISFAYGLWIMINALLGRVDVRGFATVVALTAFLLGLVIVMLGIIGEYVWRIFDEVSKRPESVIDEVY